MSNISIVCVDDEPTILLTLKKSLQNHFGRRFVYETASSAEEAFEVIDELVADGIRVVLVISDWLMPGMRGDEFLILVKQKYPNVHTIMITGQADEAAKERVLKVAQALRIFDKPWNATELFELINKVCPEPTGAV